MRKKSILICGAGSFGTYLGILLRNAGHEVTLYGRKKLKKIGKQLLLNGEQIVLPTTIYKLQKNTQYDVIFITSKLYDIEKIVSELDENENSADIYVCSQNGMFKTEAFPKLFQKDPVVVTSYGSYSLTGNQLTAKEGEKGRSLDDNENGHIIKEILEDAGLSIDTNHVRQLRLLKMLYICTANGLCALHAKTQREVFLDKNMHPIIDALFDQAYDILTKAFDIHIGEKKKLKADMYEEYPKSNHYVSTYRDVINGKDNELAYLNGYIIKLGKSLGLPYDQHEKLLQDLEPVVAMYSKARKKDEGKS